MIETRLAALGERLVVKNLMELYQHDFSEIDGTDLGEDGRYGYYDLDYFWIHPNWSAYVIVVEGKWAGFALINNEVHIQGNTLAIVEFFVVRKYRRQGVGKLAAKAIMDANPGSWEIRVLEQNLDARRFWTGLLDKLWPAKYSEALLNDERWHGPVFSVDTQL
jgi:predicted acetyltransferase